MDRIPKRSPGTPGSSSSQGAEQASPAQGTDASADASAGAGVDDMAVQAGLAPGAQIAPADFQSPLAAQPLAPDAEPPPLPVAVPHLPAAAAAQPGPAADAPRSQEAIRASARAFALRVATDHQMTHGEVIDEVQAQALRIGQMRQDGQPVAWWLDEVIADLAAAAAPEPSERQAAFTATTNAAIAAHRDGRFAEARGLWDQAAWDLPAADFATPLRTRLSLSIATTRNEAHYHTWGEGGLVMAAWHHEWHRSYPPLPIAALNEMIDGAGGLVGAMDLLHVVRTHNEYAAGILDLDSESDDDGDDVEAEAGVGAEAAPADSKQSTDSKAPGKGDDDGGGDSKSSRQSDPKKHAR